MNPVPFPAGAPPPWIPILPPNPPPASAFWEIPNVHDRMRDLQDTINLAKAMQKELEILIMVKDKKGSNQDGDDGPDDSSIGWFSKFLEDRRINFEAQEFRSVEAANVLMSRLRLQLEPFKVVTDETSLWEEKSAAVRLGNKIHKSKRNKRWRKKKRKRVAEMLAKNEFQEQEQFDQADQEADEWRAREIAKDIAKRKMEKMKEIAKLKAKEERKALESELEMVLIVDKLQELRSIRIQKLKKQGHFLPEEDDKFLEKVRAAVEEEERQAMAAADTDAAKDAIATAEESRRNHAGHAHDPGEKNSKQNVRKEENQDEKTEGENKRFSTPVTNKKNQSEGQSFGGGYNSVASLPIEFYHYYHGSNTDMGTLIEVRRAWDAYIRPGGSRIPGHWVQPSPPADEVWASYLVAPKRHFGP